MGDDHQLWSCLLRISHTHIQIDCLCLRFSKMDHAYFQSSPANTGYCGICLKCVTERPEDLASVLEKLVCTKCIRKGENGVIVGFDKNRILAIHPLTKEVFHVNRKIATSMQYYPIPWGSQIHVAYEWHLRIKHRQPMFTDEKEDDEASEDDETVADEEELYEVVRDQNDHCEVVGHEDQDYEVVELVEEDYDEEELVEEEQTQMMVTVIDQEVEL